MIKFTYIMLAWLVLYIIGVVGDVTIILTMGDIVTVDCTTYDTNNAYTAEPVCRWYGGRNKSCLNR